MTECPKCKINQIWVETVEGRTWLRCRCGLMKLIKKQDGKITVTYSTPEEQVRLPARGTRLHSVLMVVASFDDIQTVEIADIVGSKTDKVATSLTVLGSQGLVKVTEERKGISGGSYWRLSKAARKLIGGV